MQHLVLATLGPLPPSLSASLLLLAPVPTATLCLGSLIFAFVVFFFYIIFDCQLGFRAIKISRFRTTRFAVCVCVRECVTVCVSVCVPVCALMYVCVC